VFRRRHTGFTLLEICLALAIGLMIIALSVPSIAGLLAEQKLKRSFDRFDQLVSLAHVRSVTEQRDYGLVWEGQGISLLPLENAETKPPGAPVERLVFAKNENFQLRRTAALIKNPPGEWTFWRNGTCEPAQISFQGVGGTWLVSYAPLTAHATFLKSDVP
jgi:type II secretory pathway pseudopilin PulG